MSAKTFSYNLSGHGKIEVELYDYAQKYLEFMEDINVIDRLANTDQLGALTNVHHGAHYTRYEYVLLQWYLIYKVKENLEDTGFGSEKDDFGEVNQLENPPTVAEILQSLSLLANMGHFPDTFAASKLWLHLLNNNELKVRTGFRRGLKANLQNDELKKDLSNLLDSIIDSFDIHNIHVLNAIFLLRRYRARSNRRELIDLGVRALVDYLKYKSGKETFEANFKEHWQKYTKIRKLSYLFLDSSYTPIPFKMDLHTIITNLEQIIGNSTDLAGTLNEMIQGINSLLQHSLYLSGKSIITSTKRSRELEKSFYETSQKEDFSQISTIKKLIGAEKQDEEDDEEDNEIRVFEQSERSHSIEGLQSSSTIFVLSYQGSEYIKEARYYDLFKWEKKIQEKCGKQTCNVSVHKNPDGTILKIALELDNEVDFIHQRNSLLNFTSYLIGLDEELTDAIPGTPEQSIRENNTILVEQILNLVFQRKFSFKLSSPSTVTIPIFYGQGSTKISNQVSEYLDTLGRELEEHEEHEMSMMKEYLKELDYEGYVIAFGGRTDIWEYTSTSQDGEFDGVIVLPNRENYLTILEAKDTPHGWTDAKNQLEGSLENFGDDFDVELPSYSINTFNKAALAHFYENKTN